MARLIRGAGDAAVTVMVWLVRAAARLGLARWLP